MWKDWGQEEKGTTEDDSWMASPTQWTWVWASPGRCWRTGKPGVLHPLGSQCKTRQSEWTTLKWSWEARRGSSHTLINPVSPAEATLRPPGGGVLPSWPGNSPANDKATVFQTAVSFSGPSGSNGSSQLSLLSKSFLSCFTGLTCGIPQLYVLKIPHRVARSQTQLKPFNTSKLFPNKLILLVKITGCFYCFRVTLAISFQIIFLLSQFPILTRGT